ncbi:aspartate racemase [Endozoicomonas sp. (ex Bugula neritina AB1)]|nr:aspartate racemase [Endozoicomonas sp. (ex Bugula neritina AB1)]
MLGVLGGMGPLATVDFMQKVISSSKAGSDQEHIPMMVRNVPQIPDRTASILYQGDDPYPALLDGLQALERSGVQCVVIPCNTAHFWFDRLQQQAQVPMISILDCVSSAIHARKIERVGLMATNATVATGIYKQRIESEGGVCLTPDNDGQEEIMRSIYDIKAGRTEEGCRRMEKIFNQLISDDAQAVILGCTEIPVGLADVVVQRPLQCIDATALLAEACVSWYYSAQPMVA